MTTRKRTSFAPTFTITPAMANSLMRIEAVKQAIQALPITPRKCSRICGRDGPTVFHSLLDHDQKAIA